MAVAVITSCNDKTPASVPDRFSYKSWLEGTWTGTISDPSSSGAIELRFNNGQIYVSIPQLQFNYDLATNLKLNEPYMTSFSEEATDELYNQQPEFFTKCERTYYSDIDEARKLKRCYRWLVYPECTLSTEFTASHGGGFPS